MKEKKMPTGYFEDGCEEAPFAYIISKLQQEVETMSKREKEMSEAVTFLVSEVKKLTKEEQRTGKEMVREALESDKAKTALINRLNEAASKIYDDSVKPIHNLNREIAKTARDFLSYVNAVKNVEDIVAETKEIVARTNKKIAEQQEQMISEIVAAREKTVSSIKASMEKAEAATSSNLHRNRSRTILLVVAISSAISTITALAAVMAYTALH